MTPVRAACLLLSAAALGASQPDDPQQLADRIAQLTRSSAWTAAPPVPLAFRAHHPQGLVKIGSTFFLSSVEILEQTTRHPQPVDGYDRTTGRGRGHLFKFDANGRLITDLQLGEGAMYHPGGIDFDGTSLWVPVAEYRPGGPSIVYRVDPESMRATEAFRFGDHLGAIVYDAAAGVVHAVNWGSRRFYRLPLTAGAGAAVGRIEGQGTPNPSHYVDYQDCKWAGRGRMVCTGLADLRAPGERSLRLGGLELVDLVAGRPLHQVPVSLWTDGGRPMTQNAAWIEAAGAGLRAYFVPEDDDAVLYVYDVAP